MDQSETGNGTPLHWHHYYMLARVLLLRNSALEKIILITEDKMLAPSHGLACWSSGLGQTEALMGTANYKLIKSEKHKRT